MTATLHAAFVLAMPGVAIALCRLGWMRPPTKRRALVAVVAALPILLLPGHMCDAGQAHVQMLVGGLSIIFVVTCVTTPSVAAVFGFLMAFGTFGLVSHYEGLVHGDSCLGRREESSGIRRNRLSRLESSRTFLLEMKDEIPGSLDPGWVTDNTTLARALGPFARYRREWGEPFWHSAFTRLYRRSSVPVELWCPGGPPAEAAAGLEWRDRPQGGGGQSERR